MGVMFASERANVMQRKQINLWLCYLLIIMHAFWYVVEVKTPLESINNSSVV